MNVIVINSAAYVIPEFRNEFGLIPPAFLPIGNKKLLVYQVEVLRQTFSNEHKIVLSLPKSFNLSSGESDLLKELGVEPVFVEDDLSLGMALLYLLNTTDYNNNEPVRLLHGDTLIKTLPQQSDCIAVASTKDDYAWEAKNNTNENLVWCGYFAFSSVRQFVKALAIEQGNFIKAVHRYAAEVQYIDYPVIKDWFDLGHVNTYFRSRSKITTQRAFNDLKIHHGTVRKSGVPAQKIEAEASWFINLPARLKRFTPQFIQKGIENGKLFYETEYLPCLPLNEIFVHGKNSVAFWENILNLIDFYMNESRKINIDDSIKNNIERDSIALYRNKTLKRLEEYASQKQFDLNISNKYDGVILPSIRDIAQECIDKTLMLPIVYSIIHGDLCFSNIMYDPRSNNIKVIDPRGGLNAQQELTIYGNQSYDLAKLYHSFIGLYDFIIADSFKIKKSNELGVKLVFDIDDRLIEVQNLFMSKSIISKINNRDMIAPTILLFLSMLPLHFDKPHRQEAMIANALRLYIYWKELQ